MSVLGFWDPKNKNTKIFVFLIKKNIVSHLNTFLCLKNNHRVVIFTCLHLKNNHRVVIFSYLL